MSVSKLVNQKLLLLTYLVSFQLGLFGQIDLSLSSPLCLEDQVQIQVKSNISFSSYSWTGPHLIDGSVLQPFIDGPGTYTITAIQANNSATISESIVVMDQPIPDFNISSSDVITCTQRESLLTTNINSQNQYTYLWTSVSGKELGTDPSYDATFGGIHYLQITNPIGCTKTDSIEVLTDIPTHSLSFSMDSLTCDEVGQLFVTGDTEIASVSWTGPFGFRSDERNPMIDRAGSYQASVTFTDQCRLERYYKADYFDYAPDVEFTEEIINCDFPEIEIAQNTNTNYSYQWEHIGSSFTSSEAEPTISEKGFYQVSVTDESGCEAIYFTLAKLDTIHAEFDIITDQLNCALDSTILNFEYNTVTFREFAWKGPDIDANNLYIEKPQVAQPGIYEITGKTKNGCPFQESTTVTQDIEPINITNSINEFEIDCIQRSEGLKLSTDRAAQDFQWQYEGNTISVADSISVDKPGNYIAKVIGTNACFDELEFTITGDFETTSVEGETALFIDCNTPEVSINATILDALGGTDFTFEWFNEQMQNTGVTALAFPSDTTGLFILNSTNLQNGCERIDTFKIEEDFTLPEFDIQADSINCSKTVAEIKALTSNDNLQYVWTTVEGTVQDTSTISTKGDIVYLESKGANGCVKFDTINIIADTLRPVVSFDIQSPKCQNTKDGVIEIINDTDTNGTLEYALNDVGLFQRSSLFRNLRSGEYTAYVIDEKGCSFDTLIYLDEGSSIDVESLSDITVNEGESVLLSPTVTQTGSEIYYTWTGHSIIDCTDCPEVTVEPLVNQTITVFVEDEFGCQDKTVINVLVNDLPDVWLANIISKSANNPENQEVTLYVAPFVEKIIDFSIYDNWGNLIFSKVDIDPSQEELKWDGISNGRLVSSGVYVMQVNYVLKSGEQLSYNRSLTLLR